MKHLLPVLILFFCSCNKEISQLQPTLITFNGWVFLQGAYSGTDMQNTLNDSSLLPNTSPYPQAPASVSTTFFSAHPAIVDWILIEFRNATNNASIVAFKSAFVKKDGTLIDINGSDNLTVNNVTEGQYIVVIHHRNHLSIRSANPIDFSSGAAAYNFTSSANKSFQNQSYTSTVQIGSIWAMRAGNAYADNQVKYNGPFNDQNQIQNVKLGGSLSLVLTNQYATEDINMDGLVKTNGPGNDQNFLLNIILGGSLSLVTFEQLRVSQQQAILDSTIYKVQL